MTRSNASSARSAMRGRVGERTDDLEQLEHRARPAMGHDHRQGIGMLRANVNEVDVEAVDLGDELRQGIQLRLRLAPVVAGAPIFDERLELGELYALRLVIDRLAVGPARRGYAPAKLVDLVLRDVDGEGADRASSPSRRAQRPGKQADGAGGSRGGKKFAPCGR